MNEKNNETIVLTEYRPISAFGYVGYNLLFSIPVIGFILLIIFSFDKSNINRRNYARSFFVTILLSIIVIIIITTVFSVTLPFITE